MPFGENLRWLIAYRHVTPKQLADVCEVKANTISNYANGISAPNYEILNKIIKFLDVTADQILYDDLPSTGLTEKMVPNLVPNVVPNTKKAGSFPALNTPKIITIDNEQRETTLFVTAKAAAGYLSGYEDPEYIETLQTIDLPGLQGQTHRAFEIKGQSMMPTHHSGSIAIGRFVESFNDIRDRRVYILVTKDGVVLKRVINRIKEENKLVLISDNDNKKDFPTYVVSPEDVLEVWYWRASIIRESPEPGTVYTRINDLEGRLAMIETLLKAK
jgi:transcriptional regulator with XRE-family HTH domain